MILGKLKSLIDPSNHQISDRTMWSAPPPPLSFNNDDGLLLILHSPATEMKEEDGEYRNSDVTSAEDFSRQAHPSVELLLGYLPPKRSLWSSELKQKRSQYKHYKDELLTSPESMKNILLVLAKLNHGFRYVQGMNEFLAPIFYIVLNGPDEDSSVS
ncbi:unnamed protein product [Brassica napus]|uniref:(rape) hypothetical protein n=1 Tax=Brassica napus TaxID=3708 RepID=A0A817B1C4_BRANA|nr:unnamed protein product [Brassica napus]